MQTFLPFATYRGSAFVLDNKRLGKQRVEVKQIYRTLRGETQGWKHHPAVKMWRGYEQELLRYGREICQEWVFRGFNDTLGNYFDAELRKYASELAAIPPWLGDEMLHESHRSNLVRKLPSHYRQFFPDTPDDIPYWWPE